MQNCKNYITKGLTNSLIILSLLSIAMVQADDDVSKGLFDIDTVNDPPYFVDVYNTSELITPNEDVDFYAVVLDVDNTSAQVNVTLFYTFSLFYIENYSVEMPYASTVDVLTYRFEYTFAGQDSGTYMYYYFVAFDGTTKVKEDNGGLLYDIQWSYPPVTVVKPIPDTTYPKPIKPNYLVAWMILMLLFASISFLLYKAKNGRTSA